MQMQEWKDTLRDALVFCIQPQSVGVGGAWKTMWCLGQKKF